MPRLTEYKDMNPRAKAVVEDIAKRRNIDPADINNVWKAMARHPAVMEQFAAEMKAAFAPGKVLSEEMHEEFMAVVLAAQKGNKIAMAYRVPVDAAFEEK